VSILFFCAKRKNERKCAPQSLPCRVPKAALKKTVTAPQLVAAFLNTTLANLEGGIKAKDRFDYSSPASNLPRQVSKTGKSGRAVTCFRCAGSGTRMGASGAVPPRDRIAQNEFGCLSFVLSWARKKGQK
jgi:hypothetical protein